MSADKALETKNTIEMNLKNDRARNGSRFFDKHMSKMFYLA